MGANDHISGTGKSGAFAENSGNAVRLKPEVEARIAKIEPPDTPVLTILNMMAGKSETIGAPTYNVQEEWPIAHMLQGTAIEPANETTIAMADTTWVIPATIIMNTRTDEKMYVATVPNATSVTVVRHFGTTAAAATLATDRFMVLGVATEEGQDKVQAVMRATGSHVNYAQKIAKAAAITDIMENRAVYGPTEKSRLNEQNILDYKRQWNRTLIYGEPFAQPAGTVAGQVHTIYTTGGIRYWAQLYNRIDMGGEFTWKTFARALQACSRFGGKGEKVGLTSQRLWVEISSMPEVRDLTRVERTETEVGWEINRIKFPGGRMNLMVDYNTEEQGLDDECIVFDMRYLSMAVYEGESAEQDTQTPGAYRKEWQIFSRKGLKQRLPVSSGLLYNMENAA